jgi:hypothetical protein
LENVEQITLGQGLVADVVYRMNIFTYDYEISDPMDDPHK